MTYGNYDSYSGSTAGGDFETNPELKVTPYTTIEGDLDRVFGASSPYGNSLGVPFNDVQIVDGALYVDMSAEGRDDVTLKLFSWKEATGYSVSEALDRGETPTADDAPSVLPKTYGDTQKTYELIGARMMAAENEDGDEILEASSRFRDYDVSESGEIEFDEFEDLDGDSFGIGDVMMWHGTSDNGPTATATRLASLITRYGDEAVDEGEEHEWLVDTSGDDILRDDLSGRRIRYIVVKEDSQETEGRQWNRPILEDVKTGEQIVYSNSDEGDSGN